MRICIQVPTVPDKVQIIINAKFIKPKYLMPEIVGFQPPLLEQYAD